MVRASSSESEPDSLPDESESELSSDAESSLMDSGEALEPAGLPLVEAAVAPGLIEGSGFLGRGFVDELSAGGKSDKIYMIATLRHTFCGNRRFCCPWSRGEFVFRIRVLVVAGVVP